MTYITELDQTTFLKKCWHQCGNFFVAAVVLVIVGSLSWSYWHQHRENQLSAASALYEALTTNLMKGETGAAENNATLLIKKYKNTPYAQLAELQLAKQKIYQHQWSAAENQLSLLLKQADHGTALAAIARIRLARVLAENQQPEAALKLLEKLDNPAYISASEEIKGDILAGLGKKQEALQAYQAAMKAFSELEVVQPLLQMKIDDLSGSLAKKSY